MKKFLALFMVFFFLGAFVVQAASNPIEEKQVMSFVFDVGAVTIAPVMEVTTIDANMTLYEPMVLLTKSIPGLLTVYYGSKKIRYDTIIKNGSNTVYREVITVGDHIPIAA